MNKIFLLILMMLNNTFGLVHSIKHNVVLESSMKGEGELISKGKGCKNEKTAVTFDFDKWRSDPSKLHLYAGSYEFKVNNLQRGLGFKYTPQEVLITQNIDNKIRVSSEFSLQSKPRFWETLISTRKGKCEIANISIGSDKHYTYGTSTVNIVVPKEIEWLKISKIGNWKVLNKMNFSIESEDEFIELDDSLNEWWISINQDKKIKMIINHGFHKTIDHKMSFKIDYL